MQFLQFFWNLYWYANCLFTIMHTYMYICILKLNFEKITTFKRSWKDFKILKLSFWYLQFGLKKSKVFHDYCLFFFLICSILVLQAVFRKPVQSASWNVLPQINVLQNNKNLDLFLKMFIFVFVVGPRLFKVILHLVVLIIL